MLDNEHLIGFFLFFVGFFSAGGGAIVALTRLLTAWEREKDLREQNARLAERVSKVNEVSMLKEAFGAQRQELERHRHELDKKILRLEVERQEQDKIDMYISSAIAKATQPKLGQYPEKF